MWNLVSVCVETVLLSVHDRYTVCTKHTIGSEIAFGRIRWYSQVTWVKWKIISVHLEIVLISAQDRGKVCAECTMGM